MDKELINKAVNRFLNDTGADGFICVLKFCNGTGVTIRSGMSKEDLELALNQLVLERCRNWKDGIVVSTLAGERK